MVSYRIFDEYCDLYDKWYLENRVIAENEVRAVGRLLRPGLSLEIGVGTGYFAWRLGVDLGVDPARKPLFKARSRGVDVVQAFGEKLPFGSGVFDNVLLILTLSFLEKPLMVLEEAWRVLRKGGSIIVCTVPRDSVWGRYYEELRREGKSVFFKYARLYSLREVEELMERAGFKIEEYSATLSSLEPIREEPSPIPSRRGFVCIRGVKQ